MQVHSEIKPFVLISKKLCRDEELTAADKSVALVLSSFKNNDSQKAFVKRKTILKYARVSEATLTRSLKRLEEKGYISVKAQYLRDSSGNFTGERGSNLYSINNV